MSFTTSYRLKTICGTKLSIPRNPETWPVTEGGFVPQRRIGEFGNDDIDCCLLSVMMGTI